MRSLLDFLVSRGFIDSEEVEGFNRDAEQKGCSVYELVLQSRRISEDSFLRAVSEECNLPYRSTLTDADADQELIKDLPIQYLKRHYLYPLQKDNGKLHLALSNPFALQSLDEMGTLLQARPIPVLAPSDEVLSAINRSFGETESVSDEIIRDVDQDEEDFSRLEPQKSGDLLEETSDAPVVRLVNHVLARAVRSGASDIHLEPYEDKLFVRLRLDGVLYTFYTLSRKLHAPVISRVKVMAGLNIAEKRVPQDGRIEIRIGNRRIDLRISCLPTIYGERVVMRLLEKDARLLSLEEIGLDRGELQTTRKLVSMSHGIILVTGPTGSGKTTSLYSALNYINTPDKNILTVEDPVEYQLEGVGQMQINTGVGLTFANSLRSMLRQDPDVILVGEIRDLETAEIAVQAALTGHLVFSTLHTNDASSGITRLINMGIEPFLASSSLRAIVAQRLVRLLCPACKQPYSLPEEEISKQGLEKHVDPEQVLYSPAGCEHCLHTGYKGRTALFEILELDEALQSLILRTSDSNSIRREAITSGMTTLRDNGFAKVSRGLTSIDEVLRVTQI
ncbi:MAG: type II secretion system ATPase GspE [Desulfohalobiaceae bacterium]|nr:type II secretion system ATPase GspE [Desulfohalobiaceae bacterium]